MKRIFSIPMIAFLVFGCDRNHKPVISDLTCSPDSRNAGTIFTLKVTASDEDGDGLNYLWKADEGTFITPTNNSEVQWKSPASGAGKTFTITVVISDGKNEVTRNFLLLLGVPELGSLDGHINYTNFKIPITGAIVTVGDKTSSTNNDGYFVLSGILAGECTLTASKDQFTVTTLVIQIPANDTLSVTLELTSANNTTKLSGIVTDPDAFPLENARVVVLNPDGSESKLITTTNSVGYYRLWYIPFGTRTLVVTKPETEDIRYPELKETIMCQDIESQLNITLHKVLLRGTFTDSRDNHIYPFKTIGNLTWMTENLSYLPKAGPSAKGSGQEAFYYVYGYQGTDTLAAKGTENYKKYGVLYNWPAASKACPAGWHLPSSDLEWDVLTKGLGSQAGMKMKSELGWADHGGGDNSSGFSAIPGGEVKDSGVFAELEYNAYFWSSSKLSGIASYKGLIGGFNDVYSLTGSDKLGLSVRCVRNH